MNDCPKKLNFLGTSFLLVVCTLSGGKFMLLENGTKRKRCGYMQSHRGRVKSFYLVDLNP